MTQLPITISEDTTLGEAHSGMRILVDAVITITLPHENNYKFVQGDEFEIISDIAGNIKVEAESGVTITPLPTALITSKGASVKIQYQGDNVYLMWGSL